ncbi:hypothetical protein [Exiguobacterium sp. s63]|uniref:hypothetical protein n=1 Tax=Exiguobacterium sp. s63 TaxID=2751274 RepID=UPI001BEAE261|nr:hypothetical protein [Exiguobacterium sp. s63]
MGVKKNNLYYIGNWQSEAGYLDNQEQVIEVKESEELFSGESEFASVTTNGTINLHSLLLNSRWFNSTTEIEQDKPNEIYHPFREGSDQNMVDKRIDRLEYEFDKHKEVTDLKLKGIEERLESKIDISINQVLGAIKDMESQINNKLHESQASTMNKLNEIKDKSLTENDVKVVISEEIRNASSLKHTKWAVYIAIVVPIVILFAERFIN